MSQGSAAAGIALVCDEEGTVAEILRDGLGLGLAPGRPLAGMVDPACADKAGAFLKTLRAQDAAFNWELTVPTADGHVLPLHFAGGATEGGYLVVGARSRSGLTEVYEDLVRINNEQATALRAALKDASLQLRSRAELDDRHFDELSRLNNELATAQRELAKSNVELDRLNVQKNELLGIAAHDLRNPLQVILTYSQFLLDEAQSLGPEHREFVETIRTSSDFMLHLVDDLLDVARIEAGTLDLDLAPVDPGALVERNVARNRVLAETKGTRIELLREGEARPMILDAAKIEQVLNNLIGNAFKFSHPGTTVRVSVRRLDDTVEFAVTDEGQGIPADELDKVFGEFQRVSTKPTADEHSTGLGLSICKRIVGLHTGRIGVESEQGIGSRFFFTLPLAVKEGQPL